MFGGWSVGQTGEDLFQVGPWLNLVILTAGNQRCQARSAVASALAADKQEDYDAFERVLKLAHERVPLPIYAYCVLPNHWHFMVQRQTDTQITEFFRWMTHTHTMRWHAHYHTEGERTPLPGSLQNISDRRR